MYNKFKFFSNQPTYRDDVPEGFELYGVTPTLYSPNTFNATKFILLKDLGTGTIARGREIDSEHPLWDYINTERTP